QATAQQTPPLIGEPTAQAIPCRCQVLLEGAPDSPPCARLFVVVALCHAAPCCSDLYSDSLCPMPRLLDSAPCVCATLNYSAGRTGSRITMGILRSVFC